MEARFEPQTRVFLPSSMALRLVGAPSNVASESFWGSPRRRRGRSQEKSAAIGELGAPNGAFFPFRSA